MAQIPRSDDGKRDFFALVDAPILSRILACFVHREALRFAYFASDWPRLVVSNQRKLLVTPSIPLAVLDFAAPSIQNVRELVINGQDAPPSEKFWMASEQLLKRLEGRPLTSLTFKNLHPRQNDKLRESYAQVKLLEAVLNILRVPSLLDLALENLQTFFVINAPTSAIRFLVQALRTTPSRLASLSLAGCSLSDRGMKGLLPAFREGPAGKHLRRLDLSTNDFGAEGAELLSGMLPTMSCLQALLLSGNGFGPRGAIALVPGLQSVQGSLLELDLSVNGLGAVGVEALASAALQLRTLHLRGNWLTPAGVDPLIQLVEPMATSLTKLDLAQNKLNADGVLHLLQSLPAFPELEALNLAENHFADANFVAAPVSRLAQAAPRLRELNLNACLLGIDEAVLASVVEHLPPTLTALELGVSDLHGQRLECLLGTLPEMPRLVHLGLVQARLDDAGAGVLAERLPWAKLPRLQSLDVCGNHISREALARLALALRRGACFKRLRTSNNSIPRAPHWPERGGWTGGVGPDWYMPLPPSDAGAALA